MAIDFFDCVYMCVVVYISSSRYLYSHIWETEVKVTEAKQTAFPLVTSAAAVTFRPGRLGSPRSAHYLHPII